jgi:magnesium transporter
LRVGLRNLARVIRAWRYALGKEGGEPVDPLTCGELVDPGHAVLWIDAAEPTDAERDAVRDQLRLGAVVLDALIDPSERTKLMRYGDYFHVAIHDCQYIGDEFDSREIDIVMGPGWLLTVRHPTARSKPLDIDDVMHRFEVQRQEHSTTEEGYLLWALFDVVVDRYFDVNDSVDDRLETIEEVVFSDDGQPGIPRDVFSIRRDLMLFRRAAAPMREVIDAIIRKDVPFVSEEAVTHFHDVYDRLLRVLDLIESQRDLLTGLLEADLAVISNRLNTVMKKVTSWGAILVVATLIAGIYGMNFKHMPELSWSFGYPAALLSMLAITGILYWVFKRRDWL